MRRWCLLVGSLAGIVSVFACGDSEPVPLDPIGEGGSIQPDYSVDTVCEPMAMRLCAARENCCRAVGLPYDPIGCVQRQQRRCESMMDVIRRGDAILVPERVDTCFEEWERTLQRCIIPATDLVYETYDLGRACAEAFHGTKEEGELCEDSVECEVLDDAVQGCEAGRCMALRVRSAGEMCDGANNFCRPGLYCDYDLASDPLVGTCAEALPLGAMCDPNEVVSSCGVPSFCGLTEDGSTCVVRQPPGSQCDSLLQCASFECEENQCVTSPPVVTLEACTG